MFLPLLLALLPDTAPAPAPVPKDFRIEASYLPGFSTWASWNASVDSGGHIAGREAKALPTADVAALAKAVDDADFFALKPNLGAYGVTCGDFCRLKVTKGGRTREVTVYFASMVAKDPEVRRFNAVWDAFLKRVPSPNKGQAPAPPRP